MKGRIKKKKFKDDKIENKLLKINNMQNAYVIRYMQRTQYLQIFTLGTSQIFIIHRQVVINRPDQIITFADTVRTSCKPNLLITNDLCSHYY